MSVNNGSNTGSLPAGTPFTGTFTYDNTQVPTSVAFSGGTHATYTFNTISRFPGIPSSITIRRTSQVRVAPATPR